MRRSSNRQGEGTPVPDSLPASPTRPTLWPESLSTDTIRMRLAARSQAGRLLPEIARKARRP